MAWPGPILTDSGGYQVFSLADLRRLDEEGGFLPQPYRRGQGFSQPEKAVEVQETLGVDVMMCLDECTPHGADRAEARRATELTMRWAERSAAAWNREGASNLFGIVQGGRFLDLRRDAARRIADLDLPGNAIGGLAFGESLAERLETIEAAAECLPRDKPLYLMGVGTPEDLIEGMARGADLFDCVLPTRNARNGQFFTRQGRLVVKNARFRDDERPVDEECGCYTCRTFSRAYLRHLYVSGELLAYRLNSIHNLHYYLSLTAGARAAAEGR